MLTTNFHTHTYRCKHAVGDVDDYCRQALADELTVLGFSDHAPLPDGRWDSVRMRMDQLDDYCRAIDVARDRFPGLRILKGLECEYVAEFAETYRDLFLGEHEMDYLIGGAHWYPYEGSWVGLYGPEMDAAMLRAYADYVIESMESGLFTFIAHPDLFGNAYHIWDAEAEACSRAMLSAAADLDVPLEINGYGFRKPLIDTPEGPRYKYPWLPFWELVAEYDISVVVSSDAHEDYNVAADLEQAECIARDLGLRVLENPVPLPGSGDDH